MLQIYSLKPSHSECFSFLAHLLKTQCLQVFEALYNKSQCRKYVRQERKNSMKNSYILNGTRLYKIISIRNDYIKVIPSNEKMSKDLAAKTFYQYQLESLGYMVGGEKL